MLHYLPFKNSTGPARIERTINTLIRTATKLYAAVDACHNCVAHNARQISELQAESAALLATASRGQRLADKITELVE